MHALRRGAILLLVLWPADAYVPVRAGNTRVCRSSTYPQASGGEVEGRTDDAVGVDAVVAVDVIE